MVFLPSEFESGKALFPKEAFSTEVGGTDLGARKMFEVAPVETSSAVVIRVHQFVCECVVHVALRVDVVLTKDYL